VFSYMNGIIHPYYMVALAPGIAALAGIGAAAWWQARPGSWPVAGRIAAASGVLASAVWAYILLDRTPDWLPWLRWVALVAGVAATGLVLAGPALARLTRSRRARLALAVAPLGLALVAGLAGPAAYALDTVGTAHTGAIPSAGPASVGFGGGPGGAPGGRGGFPGAGQASRGSAGTGANAAPGGNTAPGGAGAPGGTGTPNGSGASSGSTALGGTAGTGAASGAMPGGTSTGAMPRGDSGGFGAGNGPGGGLGGDTTVSSALRRLLEKDAASYTWVAATEGSEGAAPLELATGDAVMAIGGFNGTDPWPTLAVFKELVAKHEIHYYVGQGSQSFGGGRGSSAITSWVEAHFTKQTVGGQTVYDLTKPLS
jgi:hypothetical protein